jgi:hypothetical protein
LAAAANAIVIRGSLRAIEMRTAISEFVKVFAGVVRRGELPFPVQKQTSASGSRPHPAFTF